MTCYLFVNLFCSDYNDSFGRIKCSILYIGLHQCRVFFVAFTHMGFLWLLHSEGALIRDSSVFVERCQAMIVRLQEVCPQLDIDGLNNIWIIKPGAKSRGRGEAFRKVH